MVSVERSGGTQKTTTPKKDKKVTPKNKQNNKPIIDNGAQENKTHTVGKKENVFSIIRDYKAKGYEFSIDELAAVNGWTVIRKNGKFVKLTSKEGDISLLVGETIKIPALSNSNPTPKANTSPPQEEQKQKDESSTYTIKSGDNPFTIAENKGISIRQLAYANNWEINKTEEEIELYTADGTKVVLQKGKNLNIPKSVTNRIKTQHNLSDVKKNTGMSDTFLDIIEKFEGDPDNDYKPFTKAYPDVGTYSIGYGFAGAKPGATMTYKEAYTQLAKEYLQTQEDVRLEVGDEIFNKLPKALKESVIDLVFNKGFDVIDIEKFKENFNNNDIGAIAKQLIRTKAVTADQEYDGLYKRSLARLVMLYEGLDTESAKKIKPVLDEFYAECEEKGITELDDIWQPENDTQPKQTSGKYTVTKDDKTLYSIAGKLGVKFNDLKVLNMHLAPDYVIGIGDTINTPVTTQAHDNTPIKEGQKLASEIDNIKNMDLSDEERLQKTEEIFDKYAKKYNLPQEAIDLFKADAKEEYDAWFYVSTDNMKAMAGVLDAEDPETLYKSMETAIDKSKESRKFAGLVLNKKINKDNIHQLIEQAGGNKQFINMIKKTGGFDLLKHCLQALVDDKQDNSEIFKQFNTTFEDGDYSEATRIFDNVTSKTSKQISNQLAETLDEDDDLNASLYKYQIQKVNKGNVLEVLRSNNIIAGICEAENDRSKCKEEIMKLYNMLDKQYMLDEDKKNKFTEIVNREFRERSIDPTTWWIGTEKVTEAFNSLIARDLKIKDVKSVMKERLKDSPEFLEKKDFVKTFEPTNDSGPLIGKRFVINAGHGGKNPNTKVFDNGATNSDMNIREWEMNRYMSKMVIEELQALGATVVFTTGHVNTVAYKDNNADMTISLHTDSHNAASSGPRVLTFNNDAEDKKLAKAFLGDFLGIDIDTYKNDIDISSNNPAISNLEQLDRKEKDEITFTFNMDVDDNNNKEMQTKILNNTRKAVLAGFPGMKNYKNKPSPEPSILLEYCNIQKEDEVRSMILGDLGEQTVNSLINGILKYYKIDPEQL